MKKIIEKNRTIIADFNNETLYIKGDYAPSSVTIYAIRHTFNEKIYSLHLTEERAKNMCEYYKKEYNSKDFFVTQRTLFI